MYASTSQRYVILNTNGKRGDKAECFPRIF